MNPGRKVLQDLTRFIVPLLILGSSATDANDLLSFRLQLERELDGSLIVPSHPNPGDIWCHSLRVDLVKIDIRKDNRHACKELVSMCHHEVQRGTPDHDHFIWLSPCVSSA